MPGILYYTSHLTTICFLYTVKIAKAVLPYVFKMAFPASLLQALSIINPPPPHIPIDDDSISSWSRCRAIYWIYALWLRHHLIVDTGLELDEEGQHVKWAPGLVALLYICRVCQAGAVITLWWVDLIKWNRNYARRLSRVKGNTNSCSDVKSVYYYNTESVVWIVLGNTRFAQCNSSTGTHITG